MRFVNPEDVYRAEHEVMHKAFAEWVGMDKETILADLQYLWGVHDLATKLAEFAATYPLSVEDIPVKKEKTE